MSPEWSSALAELIPLSMLIALSPLTIIPAVLVLHTERVRQTGPAFLAGWLIGLSVVTVLFTKVSDLGTGADPEQPAWTAWPRIGIGAALLVLGVHRWVSRHTKPHQMPGTRHITEASPGKAFVVGALLAVANPKVLFICVAAGLAIGTSGLESLGSGGAALAFVASAGSTVAVPVLSYVVLGKRLDPLLDHIKAWMEKHNAALVSTIFVVIGFLVLYKGIHGLWS